MRWPFRGENQKAPPGGRGFWQQQKEGEKSLFVHFHYKYKFLQAFHLLRAGRAG